MALLPDASVVSTGMYPHQVGLARNGRDLSHNAATVAELLRGCGYQTAMVGKWHLSETTPSAARPEGAEHFAWLNHQAHYDRPFADLELIRSMSGFNEHYGTIWGVVDYFDPFSLVDGTEPVKDVPEDFYYTDAITRHDQSRRSAVKPPFFSVRRRVRTALALACETGRDRAV